MEDKNKELIENLVRQSPGFKANHDLFDEMVKESCKRLQNFLENSPAQDSNETYIKKVVNIAVIDILRNAGKIREEKAKKAEELNNFKEVEIAYKTDSQGKIDFDLKLEIPDSKSKSILSDEKAEKVKEKIKKLDENKPLKEYKKIFEMKFIKEMSCGEIAQQLEQQEHEVLKSIHEIYKEISLSLTG